MLFNSQIFILLFLPVVVSVYFFARSQLQQQAAVAWLVISSLFFYGWWNPVYLLLIVGSATFNFAAGNVLSRNRIGNGRLSLAVLIFGITVNLSLLGYFKYANFFIDNVNFVFGTGIDLPPIFLPLAISFFTFQQISYLVDAYRKQSEDYNFMHYLLFVTFFPQLIAGPIVHHKEMMPQFDNAESRSPQRRNIEIGLSIFSVGLFKKIILADNIAVFSTPVFQAADAGLTLSILESWIAATAFGLQVYFDFSGYSDMAIGTARLFGIKLPINFYSPYKSENISEFWRRWHMTLTRFLTAYVYIPISLNKARKAINSNKSEAQIFWKSAAYPAMVTFLLAGVWHGAGWNFAIFGLLQGVFVVINNLWRQFRKNQLKHRLKETTLLGRILARGTTSLCFIFSLVFFKAATTAGALDMSMAMLGFNGVSLSTSIISIKLFLPYALGYFAIIFLLPNTQQFFRQHEPSLEPARKESRRGLETLTWNPTWQWALLCSGMFVTALLNINKVSEFIYFQF